MTLPPPPPTIPGAPGHLPPRAPGVLFWYRVYCGAMVALYALCFLGGVAMAVFRQALVDAENAPGEILVMGLALAALGLVLVAVFAAPFLLPRRRWAWIYGLVLIGIGMTSCACLPFTVPLLVFWIRPESQAWFDLSGAG